MSAGQTTPQYEVYGASPALMHAGFAYKISDGVYGCAVDAFRTRSAAEYAASLLNAGMARVDSHAIVGCKVIAS